MTIFLIQSIHFIFHVFKFFSEFIIDGFLFSQILVLFEIAFRVTSRIEVLVLFIEFEIGVKMMNLTKFVNIIVIFLFSELKSFIDIVKFSILILIKSQPVRQLSNFLIFGWDKSPIGPFHTFHSKGKFLNFDLALVSFLFDKKCSK